MDLVGKKILSSLILKHKKYFFKFSLPLLIVFLGFFREFLFININYRITSLHYKNFVFELPSVLFFLKNYTPYELYYFKYFLTGLTIIAYASLTALTVWFFFNKNFYVKLIFICYLLITFVSLMLFGIIYTFSDFETAYFPTRKIIELLESPILTMIILPVIYFIDLKEKTIIYEKR